MSQGPASRITCGNRTHRRLLILAAIRSSDPMKPTPRSKKKVESGEWGVEGRKTRTSYSPPSTLHPPPSADILAFGAHPDDIEFAVGGVVVKETRAGRNAHFVVCSRGESPTNGTPYQ